MKKTLVAIASLAALGAMSTSALAQSSSSIYGNLDQTLVQTSQGGKSATSSASNNNSSSYWGITSTEDMGGGLKASFDLRSEITLMTGQAASTSTSATNAGQTSTAAVTQNTVTNAGDKPSFFNRGAFLKLASDNFGAITIGRQGDAWWIAQGQVNTTTGASGGFGNLTAMQTNTTNTNLIGGANPTASLANYMGSATAAGANINPAYYPVSEAFMGGFRFDTPSIAGFQASYQIGVPKVSYNDAGSANNGSAWVLAYDGMGASIRVASTARNDYSGSKVWEQNLVGGSYTMGQWKLALSTNKSKFSGSAATAGVDGSTATGLGVFYTMSSALTLNVAYGELKDNVNSANTFKQTSLNAVYKLSPRSSVYGGIFNGVNAGPTMKQTPIYSGNGTDTLGATVNAYTVGIKHTF